MRRLAFNGLTICAIMMMSGCCLPNLFCPCNSGSGGGWGRLGCPNGQCGVRPGMPPQQGFNTSPGMIQTNYPSGPIMQQPPIAFQTSPIGHQQPIPTMALESLPTYR